MALSGEHRRFLIAEQGLGAALINIVINAAIAWAMFRSLSVVPLWGDQSIGGDLVGTTFFLPFITCLIVTKLTYGAVAAGRVPPFPWRRADVPWLARLPARTLPRALVFGVASVVLVAPPSLFLLEWLGIQQLPFSTFVVAKSAFAAGLAATVTPLIALGALADAPSPAGAA